MMTGPKRLSLARRLIAAAFVLGAGFLLPAPSHAQRGPSKLGPAARRTVVIYTYHHGSDGLAPSATFNGVAINNELILTATKALYQGHRHPFAEAGDEPREPSEVRAYFRSTRGWVMTPCKILKPESPDCPLTLLKVDPKNTAKTAEFITSPIRIDSTPSASKLNMICIAAPLPLGAGGVHPRTVPRPISVPTGLTKAAPFEAIEVNRAAIAQALPKQGVGAGLWDEDGKLRGIAAREDGNWFAVDLLSSAKFVNLPKSVTPVVGPKPPTPKPPTPKPPVAKPQYPPKLAMIMKQEGIKPAVDPRLTVHVDQEQADLIMAKIAGAKFKEAIGDINDILPLTQGTFTEQLKYRKALALTLSGDYKQALKTAADIKAAKDPLVKKQGAVLHKVLDAYPAGNVDGKPLKNPAVLIDAIKTAASS